MPPPTPDGEVADLRPDAASDSELAQAAKLKTAVALPAAGEAHLFTSASMLRFMRARPTLEKARTMFDSMLGWYRTYQPYRAAAAWKADSSPEAASISKYFPCGTHGVDKRGVSVYYGRYGLADLSGVVREGGYERFLSKGVSDQLDIMEQMESTSKAQGKALYTNIVVIDLQGMEWRRILKSVPWFGKYVKVLDENYPERLHTAFVVRAPWVFSSIYKMVSPMLSADTRRKVQILGKGSDPLASLTPHIELDQIPEFLGGGSGGWRHGDGGWVPVTKKELPPEGVPPAPRVSDAEPTGGAAGPAG